MINKFTNLHIATTDAKGEFLQNSKRMLRS